LNSRFCPKCGKEAKHFIHGFCIDCYLEDHPELVYIPDRIEVDSCTQCLRIRVKGKWISGRGENIKELITSKIKTDISSPDISISFHDETPKGAIYRVDVRGKIEGEPVEYEKYVEIVYNRKVCDICAKKGSTYYEALVQLRPKSKEVDIKRMREAFRFLRNENRAIIAEDRKAEIFRFENAKNGIDIFFGSQRAAKIALQRLSQKYDVSIKETYTLVGIDKKTGKRRYTVTYSVRL